MKRLIILTLIFVAAGVIGYWAYMQSQVGDDSSASTPVVDVDLVESQDAVPRSREREKLNNNDASEKLAEMGDELLETLSSDAEFNGISRPSSEAKAVLEEAGVLPKDLKGEAYVEFDLEGLRRLEVGDTFNLEIPQTSEMFSAEVTKTSIFDNGDKSVFGRLVGSDGELHTTVLTVGDGALYGQFTTASGNYVFESLGQHGWLAAKRDLYRNHVEFEAVEMSAPSGGADDQFAPQTKQ